MELERVKVVVAGDSGVGKTALVHLLTHSTPLINPVWTIGVSVDVKIHDYKSGTPSENAYFIEFWDVGGSISHRKSISLFFNNAHGIILLHDLNNRKSEQHLQTWLDAILEQNTDHSAELDYNNDSMLTQTRRLDNTMLSPSSTLDYNSHYNNFLHQSTLGYNIPDANNTQQPSITDLPFNSSCLSSNKFLLSHQYGIPVLVIGTFLDQISMPNSCDDSNYAVTESNCAITGSKFATQHGFPELSVNCLSERSLSPGSSDAVILDRFFDRVVDNKLSRVLRGSCAAAYMSQPNLWMTNATYVSNSSVTRRSVAATSPTMTNKSFY